MGICKAYTTGGGDFLVLDNVNLTMHKGEFVTIMGASGSGKTTLLNLLGCLDRPSSGTYLLEGVSVQNLTDKQLSHLRGRKIGFIFQSFNLLPRLSARFNVELPLVYQEVSPSNRRKIAEDMLHRVGLDGKANRRPSELSGGEQQRVAIARALASQTPLILADEPTGNLDSKTGHEIMEILLGLHKEGKTIAMVTHARDLTSYSDRTIVIKDGSVLEEVGHKEVLPC